METHHRRPQMSRSPATSLTDDCWLEVMYLLSPWDIVSMRLVNRSLYHLTHECTVWLHQAKVLKNVMPLPYVRNKDSLELERTVLQTVELDRLWSSNSPRPKRILQSKRIATTCGETIMGNSIVEGTNLLITADRKGNLFLWDMTTPSLPAAPVGKLPESPGLSMGNCFFQTVLLPEKEEVVILVMMIHGESSREWAHIIILSLAQKNITPFVSLNFRHAGPVFAVEMSGDLLLCVTERHALLVDWRQAGSNMGSFRYSDFHFSSSTLLSTLPLLRFLPNKHLLTVKKGRLAVYKFPPFRCVSQLQQPLPLIPTRPSWKFNCANLSTNTFVGGNARYLTTVNYRRWYIWLFSTDNGFRIQAFKFGSWIKLLRPGSRRSLVITKDLTRPYGSKFNLVTNQPASGTAPPSVMIKVLDDFNPGFYYFNVLFAESTGKVGLLGPDILSVYDFQSQSRQRLSSSIDVP